MDFAVEALRNKVYEAVFWVDATSEASAQRSFQEIADKITQPAPKFETDAKRIEFVERKLKDWKAQFLMVLDNYDDPSAFKNHKLSEFMPYCGSGHFLVTSRISPLTQSLRKLCTFIIEVGGMEAEEAEELLVRKAFKKPPDPKSDYSYHARMIVERLGFHALAIDLSAAYILEREKPLSQFLPEFEKRKKEILDVPPDDDDWEYQKTLAGQGGAIKLAVFTSWDLSYTLLQPESEKGRAAAYLLNLLAFLYKQGISEELFWNQDKDLQWDQYPDWLKLFLDDDDQWDRHKFEDALKELRKLSLIANYTYDMKMTEGKITGISLHPLVQDWIKIRLGIEKQRKVAIEATNIAHRFLQGKKSSVETFDMRVELKPEALSYVEVCQENIAEFCKARKGKPALLLGQGELADACETFALFFEYMGKISEAEALFNTMIDWRKQYSAPSDAALLRAQSLFTEVLRLQKKFREAEQLDREVFNMRIDLLGKDPVFTEAAFKAADHHRKQLMKEALWSAHDLGWDLEGQAPMAFCEGQMANIGTALGKVEEAEKLQRMAYDGRHAILGRDKPLTLQSVNNLAHVSRLRSKARAEWPH